MFHLRTTNLLCRIVSGRATDNVPNVNATGVIRETDWLDTNETNKALPHKSPSYQSISSAKEAFPTVDTAVLRINQVDCEEQPLLRGQQHESKILLKYSLEMTISYMLLLGSQVINVRFMGFYLDSETMAAVCLANMFAAITAYSIGNGILTAMDTLVAQAYTGARDDPKIVGIILQRGLIIISVFAGFVTIVWCYAEPILLYFHQIPSLAAIAQNYLLLCIVHMYFNFFLVCLRKFIQGIGQMKIIMYLLAFAVPINVASNYFYFVYLNLGYKAAAYHIITIPAVYGVFLLWLMYVYTDASRYWPGFTMKPFHHWGQFLKLGIPGMLSNTEWAFEICAIATGSLGKTSLAAQSIVLSCISFLLTIPSGLSTALAVRIGHHLGANRPKQAKSLFIKTASVTWSIVFLLSIFLYVVRHAIGSHFTKDAEMIQAVVDLFTIGSATYFALGIGIVSSITLNALGKQHLVATFNIISYYMIGLPIGVYLMYLATTTTSAFPSTVGHFYSANTDVDGVIGIWMGIVLAGIIKASCETSVLLFFVDWELECMRAANNVKLSK